MRSRRRAFGPVHDIRVAVWAARELHLVRRGLRERGMGVSVRSPPRRVSRRSGAVVGRVLSQRRATCLERSLVRQAWLVARGSPRDLVIGVATTNGFAAHAWLDGDSDGTDYHEILRIPVGASLPRAGLPGADTFD